MGRFEKRPDNPHQGDPYGAAETALRAVTEELQIIQRNLLKSLQEDVLQLQMEKNRLADDIKLLQEQKQELQEGRQISEQQALVRQLAQVLANHISSQLQSSLENLANQAIQGVSVANGTSSSAHINDNKKAEHVLGSLDDTLTITFNTLQQELKNYQSSFFEQLSRMQSQQQQGEAILADLVNSLRRELGKTQDTPQTTIPQAPPPQFEPIRQKPSNNSFEATTKLQLDSSPQPAPPLSRPPKAATPVSSLPPRKSQNETTDSPAATPTPEQPPSGQIGTLSLATTGLWLIVLSTLVASVYNVAIKVIFHPGFRIFGVFEVERLITPTLGNSLLILMLRMLVVVPLMLLLAPILHPRVWQDLQNLIDSARSRPTSNKAITKQVLVLSIVSGCFLFLSQVLIYLAIGKVATGMAIALFFVYPMISGLLSWFLFRDRLTLYASGALTSIGLGELLVLGGSTSIGMGNTLLESTTAIASGIAFAFYVLLTRICAAKLHPVTFTLINFATMLLLSLLSLMLPLPQDWSLQINPTHFLELILSAFILGVLTLLGYLFNNFGIRKIGANQAAIFGAIVPALTVILAGLIIQETLEPAQVLGVLLVTLGAGAFSFEKIRNRVKPSRNIS
ncbi:MAG: EamA family transporter [Stigonema ocellatum SAG 48.90 = DSM 106950]|nr:EamA family transporter [Stigonema ocellatum SAG 48.90 = DSM 106950]